MDITIDGPRVKVKESGMMRSVSNNPRAKLMYYLSCVSLVLDILKEVPSNFLDYEDGYDLLSSRDVRQLIEFCQSVSPEILKDKCFFEKIDCGVDNEFRELSSVHSSEPLPGSIVVGERNIRITKVMIYTPTWRRRNYDEPLFELLSDESYTSGSPNSSH